MMTMMSVTVRMKALPLIGRRPPRLPAKILEFQARRPRLFSALSHLIHRLDLDRVLPKLAQRKSKTTKKQEQPQSPSAEAKRRFSVTLRQAESLPAEIEALRVTDIKTDADSAASQAFAALRQDRGTAKTGSSSAARVEGREIVQDHALYGLTYGMMLGIRVLAGRSETLGAFVPGQLTRELSLPDYDYELELTFPPEGSTGSYPTPPHKLKSAFKFKDYMAAPFRAVRAMSLVDEASYMLSIAGDFNYIEFLANSKSGQFFFYSFDGKYMIKTQTKEESKLLRRLMPSYVEHLAAFPDSLLVRFFGMHRVKMKFLPGRHNTIYFVVMSSVFNSDLPVHVKYDIKGSSIGRVVSEDACRAGAVQKDVNLVNSRRVLRLGSGVVDKFMSTLEADTLLLRSLRIMDFSLLIGVHDVKMGWSGRRDSSVSLTSRRQSLDLSRGRGWGTGNFFTRYHGGLASVNADEVYFFGIIDILQVYNTTKRAETVFKALSGSDPRELSSVNPDLYSDRFLRFIRDRTDFAQVHASAPSSDMNKKKLKQKQRAKNDTDDLL